MGNKFNPKKMIYKNDCEKYLKNCERLQENEE